MLVSEGTVYVGYGDRGQERGDGLRGDGPVGPAWPNRGPMKVSPGTSWVAA